MNEGGARAARHEEVWELLPWQVNGTLAAEERELVERHLATCAECRDELERCRATAAEVRASAVAPTPHPAQLAKLLQRLEPEVKRASGALLARTPRAVRWLILGQAAALVALVATVVALAGRPAPFHTLSDAPAAAAPARQVRVVFAPETTEAELRQLLLAVRGEIVGGPSPLGAYAVSLPVGEGTEPLPVVLAYLRAHSRVRFAEPVATGDP
jgi:hypothetical protein